MEDEILGFDKVLEIANETVKKLKKLYPNANIKFVGYSEADVFVRLHFRVELKNDYFYVLVDRLRYRDEIVGFREVDSLAYDTWWR